MFEKKHKLYKEDLWELNKRDEIINTQFLIVQALNLQLNVWLNGKLKALGLDLNKQYDVNKKDGIITEKINDNTRDKKNTG